MPRIEFKTDAQRDIFNEWLKDQFQKNRVNLIGENSRGLSGEYPVKTLEVLEIEDEPVHIEVERRGSDHRRVAVKLGEGKIARELASAGIVFKQQSGSEDVVGGFTFGRGHISRPIPRRNPGILK